MLQNWIEAGHQVLTNYMFNESLCTLTKIYWVGLPMNRKVKEKFQKSKNVTTTQAGPSDLVSRRWFCLETQLEPFFKGTDNVCVSFASVREDEKLLFKDDPNISPCFFPPHSPLLLPPSQFFSLTTELKN